MKMKFQYRGVIPASKSILNRALICSSYSYQSGVAHELNISGESSCDDVLKMQEAIKQLKKQINSEQTYIYDCGAAGTVLRFLSLRMSRIPGTHILKGTERLMKRPQQDLLDLFSILGVRFELDRTTMTLHSEGWKNINKPITVERSVSSQFASGLILNAWNLSHDLILDMHGEPMSEGYLQMTVELVKKLGMKLEQSSQQILIPQQSQILTKNYVAESDLSSLFAIASYSVLNGEGEFKNFPHPSLQPDEEFLDFFKKMKINFELSNNSLFIKPTQVFQGVEANLKNCPDLFPVLAVLCGFAQTSSRLYGAPQLVYKESNRIAKTAELLDHMGISNEPKEDGMIIHPQGKKNLSSVKSFSYDTDHDHRLAFAAALAKSQNYPIEILFPEVVSKSFPEFWDVIRA